MVLWDECAFRIAEEFPDVKWDKMLVDAMTVRMVRNPGSLDVVACTNLVGCIQMLVGCVELMRAASTEIFCRIWRRRWRGRSG